jgi:hypothetical protein
MTDRGGASNYQTAGEFMAELAQDPNYQRTLVDKEAELRRVATQRWLAERPIVDELRAAGLRIDSVWDLVNTSDPYPEALPVLFKHLQRGGYPDRVMESLGRSLAVKPSAVIWYELRDLYGSAKGRGEKEGLAVALAASATQAHYDELLSLLLDEEGGELRIHFMRPVKRLGKQSGREVLEGLRDHPLLGKTARRLTGRRIV